MRFEGTPAKLDDDSWGAALFVESGDTPPAAGDGVLVKTRAGLRMTADIAQVEDVLLRRGGRLFLCELDNQTWED